MGVRGRKGSRKGGKERGWKNERNSYPESISSSRITSVNHEENEEKGGMMEEEGEEGGKEGTKGGREGER